MEVENRKTYFITTDIFQVSTSPEEPLPGQVSLPFKTPTNGGYTVEITLKPTSGADSPRVSGVAIDGCVKMGMLLTGRCALVWSKWNSEN